jgi:hypothetical protein
MTAAKTPNVAISKDAYLDGNFDGAADIDDTPKQIPRLRLLSTLPLRPAEQTPIISPTVFHRQ